MPPRQHFAIVRIKTNTLKGLFPTIPRESKGSLMARTRLRLLLGVVAAISAFSFQAALAQDLKISIPRRSQLTPVQRLNREGVDAVKKHEYEKAEGIFYKAYLYDPSDPFTLNNLGYVYELLGDMDHAQKFYAMASEQASDALVDLSNTKELQGKPMTYALNNLDNLKDVPMRVNEINVRAVELLAQDRNFEADRLLRQALVLDPQNPFTLNNLGVAVESMGDFLDALKYYDEAAEMHSSQPVVVTMKRTWRGKPVSEAAADSAEELRKSMEDLDNSQQRAIMLTLQGVTAANRNDWSSAKQDFVQAYTLDPRDAFTLNNLGYVAEKDGDLETAQFYYSKARRANDADARVGLATQRSAEGQRLFAVASDSGEKVDGKLDYYTQTRRQQTGPIELIPRGNTSGDQKTAPPTPSSVPPSTSQTPQ
jgi:Flp pilus assembly protein TadD